MKLAIILITSLANMALIKGDKVQVFLLGEGVEYVTRH